MVDYPNEIYLYESFPDCTSLSWTPKSDRGTVKYVREAAKQPASVCGGAQGDNSKQPAGDEVDKIARFKQWIKDTPDANIYAYVANSIHRYFQNETEDVSFGDDPYHDNRAIQIALSTMRPPADKAALHQPDSNVLVTKSAKIRNAGAADKAATIERMARAIKRAYLYPPKDATLYFTFMAQAAYEAEHGN